MIDKPKAPAKEEVQQMYREWAEEFFKFKASRMTDDQTQVFVMGTIREASGQDIPEDRLRGVFPYAVFKSRAEFAGLKTTQSVRVFITTLAKGPGDLVMYVYALKWKADKEGVTTVSMNELANWFPLGFPSDEQLHTAWDAQKRPWAPLGNMLDFLNQDALPEPARV